jgi:hypothetical protein
VPSFPLSPLIPGGPCSPDAPIQRNTHNY